MNLAYYKNLPLEKVMELYQNGDISKQKNMETKENAELRQSIIIALWRALTSIAALNGGEASDKVVEYYPVYTMEFLHIRNHLSNFRTQNEVMQLFDGLWGKMFKNESKQNSNWKTWEEQQKEQRIKRIIMNTIAQHLKKEGSEDSIREEWEEFSNSDIYGGDEKPIPEEVLEKRITFLKAIDSGKLWGEETAEVAVLYLENEIVRYTKQIIDCLPTEYDATLRGILEGNDSGKWRKIWELENSRKWKLNIEAAENNWTEFSKSEDGVSYTKAKQTKEAIRARLAGYSFKDKMPFVIYDEIIKELRKLATNYLVWYGRAEAQKVIDALQLSYAVFDETQDSYNKCYNRSYFIFLLQCYYKYKRFMRDVGNISNDASLLAEIATVLSDAYLKSDKKIMNTFIDRLNGELVKKKPDGKTNIEEFEMIFAEVKEANNDK